MLLYLQWETVQEAFQMAIAKLLNRHCPTSNDTYTECCGDPA